jgi:hypothetical protein
MFPVRIVLKKLFVEGRVLVLNLVVRRVTMVTERVVNMPKDCTTVGTAYGYKKKFSILCAPDIKVWRLLALRKEKNCLRK